MKPRISILITTTMFLTALTSPAWLSAQHTRYKLVDLGTFGGPESTIFIAGDNYNQVLNNRGTVTGFADTPASEPFPNFPFFDGFVTHAFGRTGSHKLRAPTAYSEPSAGITGLLAAEQGTTKIGNSTPNLLDSLDADRIRFSTTSSCALYGRPCSPNGGYPRCCGTLQCVFSGGSTRVGYACK
jgi:hypothetical protein